MPDPTPHLPDLLRRCAELRDRAVSGEFGIQARQDAAMHLAYEVGALFDAVRTFYSAGLRAMEDLERLPRHVEVAGDDIPVEVDDAP